MLQEPRISDKYNCIIILRCQKSCDVGHPGPKFRGCPDIHDTQGCRDVNQQENNTHGPKQNSVERIPPTHHTEIGTVSLPTSGR